MTTEELLSKLRAEVERIKKSYEVYLAKVTKEDILNDLDNILSFLDTLKKEDKHQLDMTKEQIEKKALKAYPKMSMISEPHGVIPADTKSRYLGDANEKARDAYIKALTEIEELPKIKGWVARDWDGLWLFAGSQPRKDHFNGTWFVPDLWNLRKRLDERLFPKIGPDDEPVEVELIIRPYSENNE